MIFQCEFPLDVPTRNGHIYPSKYMKKAIQSDYIQMMIVSNSLLGKVVPSIVIGDDHPLIIYGDMMENATFTINSVEVKDSKLITKMTTLDNPFGNKLKECLQHGIQYQLAPRGFGHVKDNIIQENFRLMSIDIMTDYFNAGFHYKFHHKYMPQSEYHARDYNGDLDRHPLDMMNEYWWPIIDRINKTGYSDKYLLNYLKHKDIDPHSIGLAHVNDGEISLNSRLPSNINLQPIIVAGVVYHPEDREITVLDIAHLFNKFTRFLIRVPSTFKGEYPFPDKEQEWERDALINLDDDKMIMIRNALVLGIDVFTHRSNPIILTIDAEEMLS